MPEKGPRRILLLTSYFLYGCAIHLAALAGTPTLWTLPITLGIGTLGGFAFLILLSRVETTGVIFWRWPSAALRGCLLGILASTVSTFFFDLLGALVITFTPSSALYRGATKLEGFVHACSGLFWISLIPYLLSLPLMTLAGALAVLILQLLPASIHARRGLETIQGPGNSQPHRIRTTGSAWVMAMLSGALLHLLFLRACVAWMTTSAEDKRYLNHPIPNLVLALIAGTLFAAALTFLRKRAAAVPSVVTRRWATIHGGWSALVASWLSVELFAVIAGAYLRLYGPTEGPVAFWMIGAGGAAFFYWLPFAPIAFASGALLARGLLIGNNRTARPD